MLDADLLLVVDFVLFTDVLDTAEGVRLTVTDLTCRLEECVLELSDVLEEALSDVRDDDLRESVPPDFLLVVLDPDPVLLIAREEFGVCAGTVLDTVNLFVVVVVDFFAVVVDLFAVVVDLFVVVVVDFFAVVVVDFFAVVVDFLSVLADAVVALTVSGLTLVFLKGFEEKEESATTGDFTLVNTGGRASYILPRLPR